MNRSRWISILVIICILQLIPFSALGEANSTTANAGNEDEQSEFNLNDIEITVSGIPIEDLLGAAAGMFIEALEENMGDAIDGLNDVFSDYAEEMSGDLGEIETILGSLIDDTWFLNIPAVSFDTMIKRSTYDNALDLYRAQLIGEIGREGRIAMNSTENCLNNIIYIYDENGLIQAIAASVEEGSFGEQEIIFGLEGYTGTYAVSAVLFLSPSEEPYAMCNMTDQFKEQQFEAYRDYISAHATKDYGVPLEFGNQILTIIFWNEDANADWLTVVAKEVPLKLE